MSRVIKFRAYSFFDKAFRYFGVEDYPQGIYGGLSEPQQFTGLTDSKGREIWEGDIVRYYTPERSYQTHHSKYVPGPLGEYTEPLEPYIKTHTRAVRFTKGTFTFDSDEEISRNGFCWPLDMHRLTGIENRDNLMFVFSCHRESAWIDGGDDETGDCSYLCREYGLADEAALIAHLNTFEIIGNVFEDSHLLK